MSPLPLELVDAILEHLTDEESTLAACCLVCKAWIHPSRRYLFDTVDLYDNREAIKLMRPWSTAASPILPFIRRLGFLGRFYPSYWNETLSHLPLLQNLRSLTITRVPPWKLPASPETAFTNYNSVVRLHLSGVSFHSFAHLAQIVCAFRNLNALIITYSDWSAPDPPSPAISPPPNLNALEILESEWDVILQWLLSLSDIPSLHTLVMREYLCHSDIRDISVLPRFLQALGPRLRKFWFEPRVINETESRISLARNPCLRSLTILFRREELANSQYLSRLLSEIVSRELDEIVICLNFAHKEFLAVEWDRVDAILAQPQFGRVQTFRICTNHHPSALFVELLPRNHSRGIISIQSLLCNTTIL